MSIIKDRLGREDVGIEREDIIACTAVAHFEGFLSATRVLDKEQLIWIRDRISDTQFYKAQGIWEEHNRMIEAAIGYLNRMVAGIEEDEKLVYECCCGTKLQGIAGNYYCDACATAKRCIRCSGVLHTGTFCYGVRA